jgi:PPOX class probable F420-dependent enzyme
VDLPDELVKLLRQPSVCYLTTLMRDGAPQVTQVWVDTDGADVLVNSVEGHQKITNVRRDPRVALAITDSEDSSRYVEIRGEVTQITRDGAAEHIDELAQRYTGEPYPWYGGRDEVRLLLTIEPTKINSMGW